MPRDSQSRPLLSGVDEEAGPADTAGYADLDSAIAHGTMEVLRRVRIARGLRLADVAKPCGVSGAVLCRAELGHRPLRLPLLLAVSAVLDVRLSAALRTAEDEAFPLGPVPWTGHLGDLLRLYSPYGLAELERKAERARRGGGA